MSTKAERAFRVAHKIQPMKIKVRQSDGSVIVQNVDADIREDKRLARTERAEAESIAHAEES
jgi:hypothetical protein